MKGLVALFLSVSLCGIAWRYMDKPSKSSIKKAIKDNFFTITGACFVVAIAIFLSANFTVRFL